ncbi:MAG: BTAD domain-containing putative transcriptional regulator [Gemmatimonadales bacterium]|jgi:DNA-binding SARP family transcriptional activator/TolB-like protein
MIRLSLLGSLDLRAGDGRQMLSVLAQPKRVALLAYLAADRDFVRRDTLLGLFWPESDEERARHALRQSLYTLRRSLGPRVLASRGDEELGIDRDHLECDVGLFEAAVRNGEAEAALELYKGDLLEGFFLSDAAEFEKWLDGRRTTLRNQAAEAAWSLAQRAEDAGERTEAALWARKAADFSQDDEATVQRLMGMLDRLGDRAAALRAYEAFAWRLENELGLQPSPETQALISEIRAREAAAPSSGDAGSQARAEASRAHAEPLEREPSRPDESLLKGAPTVTAESERAAAKVSSETAAARVRAVTAEPETPDGEPKKSRFRLGVAVAALAAAAVIVDLTEIVQAVSSWFFRDDPDSAAVESPATFSAADLDIRRLAVLYFDDMSEGQDFDYLAAGLTDGLIQRLSHVPGLVVISRNGVKPYRNADVTLDSIVRALRTGTIVEGSVKGDADLIRVDVRLIDAATNAPIDSRTVEQPAATQLVLLDKVSLEVEEFLRKRLGEEIHLREIRKGTESPEAWSLVRRAELLIDDAGTLEQADDSAGAHETLARADLLLARAQETDREWSLPTVTRGWVAFGRAKIGRASPASWDDELLSQAIAYANDALDLAPGDPSALELRGTARFYSAWEGGTSDAAAEWAAAEGDLRAAVEADREAARAWAELSRLLIHTGRAQEAGLAAERAVEADAFHEMNKDLLFNAAYAALQKGEYEEARRISTMGTETYPSDPAFPALELLGMASPAAPEPDVGHAWHLTEILEEQLPKMASQWELLTAAVLARAGQSDSARAVISRASDSTNANALYYEANGWLLLGEKTEALRLLARYSELQPERHGQLATDPWWESLRGDPEFEALLTQD